MTIAVAELKEVTTMLKKTAFVSLGGIGGIYLKDISVDKIDYGEGGFCFIKDTNGNIIITHLNNVVYIEREVEDNAQEKK